MRPLVRPLAVLVAFTVFAGIIGCLKIGLGDPEKSKTDPTLTGFWLSKEPKSEKSYLVSVVPYDTRTSLLTYMTYTRDADRVVPQGQLTYKMWRTDVAGSNFVTLEVKSPTTLLPADAADARPYAVMRLTRDGDTKVSLQLLSDKLLEQNNVTTPEAFEALVAANINNPDLYEGEIVPFTRATPDRTDEVKSILAAFAHDEK